MNLSTPWVWLIEFIGHGKKAPVVYNVESYGILNLEEASRLHFQVTSFVQMKNSKKFFMWIKYPNIVGFI